MARFENARRLPTLKILVVASFIMNAGTHMLGTDSSNPTALNCTWGVRYYTAAADSSWRSVGVQSAIPGECVTTVSIPTSGTSQPPPPLQLLLLLKIYELQLPPPGNPCRGNYTTLIALADNPYRRTGDVCSTGPSAAWYLWTGETLKLYLYMYRYTESASAYSDWHADPAASFSLAYAVTSAINLCDSSNGSIFLDVVNTLFAFASDERYAQIPPNNVSCSKPNYTLTMAAADASKQLSVTVLAAPWNGSCWTLSYGGRRCSDSDTYYAPPGQTMRLVYWRSTFEGCVRGNTFDGFTISVSPSTFDSASSPGLSVVAGASAAAAVVTLALLTGLTVAFVMRRRRRKSRQPSPRQNSLDWHGSQPSLYGAESMPDHQHRPYAVSVGLVAEDRRYSVLAEASSQERAQELAARQGRTLPAERDVHMVDNDLYGTAFGS